MTKAQQVTSQHRSSAGRRSIAIGAAVAVIAGLAVFAGPEDSTATPSCPSSGDGGAITVAGQAGCQETIFTTSTWTVPTGVTQVDVVVVGGGGGGGSAERIIADGTAAAGGGVQVKFNPNFSNAAANASWAMGQLKGAGLTVLPSIADGSGKGRMAKALAFNPRAKLGV